MKSVYSVAVVVVTVASAAGLTWCAVRVWQRRCRRRKNAAEPDPQNWHYIGKLREINMFPVKSGAAVPLERAECQQDGLSWLGFVNRRLLPMYEDAKMGFAGVHPRMLSIKSEIVAKDVLQLQAPELRPLIVDLQQLIDEAAADNATHKRMRGYSMKMIEARHEQHEWFSRAILQRPKGVKLFIVLEFAVETSRWRTIDCDFNPIMVLNTKSIDDLNARLSPANRVDPLQFRGNLMIDTETAPTVRAYDEDNWMWMKIVGTDLDDDGDRHCTVLRYKAPCVRCILPNINVETCVRHADFEPLRTLRSYRLRNSTKEPEMGIYFHVHQMGMVRRGDNVYVQYK